MSDLDAQRLLLEREKFEFIRKQAADADKLAAELANRAMDFEYLKLAVVMILLIIIVFYLTCRFGFGVPKKKPAAPPSIPPPPTPIATSTPAPAVSASVTPAAGASAGAKKERFSPFASILTPDIGRSDASFDEAQNMPFKTWDFSAYDDKTYNLDLSKQNSEDRLFAASHELII